MAIQLLDNTKDIKRLKRQTPYDLVWVLKLRTEAISLEVWLNQQVSIY